MQPVGRPHGAVPRSGGRVAFRVSAPSVRSVGVRVEDGAHPLTPEEKGLWAAEAPAAPGDDAEYVLDREAWADPCSRFQPEGARGPSSVVDTSAFAWTDDPEGTPSALAPQFEREPAPRLVDRCQNRDLDPFFAEATLEGRRRELRFRGALPDPQAEETFERSKLDPSAGDPEPRAFCRRLLELRRTLPRELTAHPDDAAGTLRLTRGRVTLTAELRNRTVEIAE